MMFDIRNASFTYPTAKVPTFKGLNFSLKPGEVMTILGRNGIGKTTLVKCLTGIYRFTEGEVSINGKPAGGTVALKDVSYVPQTHGLAFPYSVFDMVLMGRTRKMGVLAIPSKNDRATTCQVLEEMSISHLAERKCNELSGGQMQLVYIARALVGEPKILVMDEPESALDFKNQFKILRLISNLSRERGITCIINTHYPDHALQISDKTLLMGEGRTLFGPTEQMITEDHMGDFFDVRAKIANIEVEGEIRKTFLVVGTHDKRLA